VKNIRHQNNSSILQFSNLNPNLESSNNFICEAYSLKTGIPFLIFIRVTVKNKRFSEEASMEFKKGGYGTSCATTDMILSIIREISCSVNKTTLNSKTLKQL